MICNINHLGRSYLQFLVISSNNLLLAQRYEHFKQLLSRIAIDSSPRFLQKDQQTNKYPILIF
jgi:hypothetical protein